MNKTKYPLLFFAILLFGCNKASQTSSVFEKDLWMIDSQGVGIIQLGDPIQETRSKVIEDFDVLTSLNGGFDMIGNDDVLVKVSPIAGRVGVIEIYTDKFETASGVKIGMTIEEIETIHNDFLAQMDEMNGRVYFSPQELQSSNSVFCIHFKTEDDSPVWNFEKRAEKKHFTYAPTGELNKKAIVEVIRIYKK